MSLSLVWAEEYLASSWSHLLFKGPFRRSLAQKAQATERTQFTSFFSGNCRHCRCHVREHLDYAFHTPLEPSPTLLGRKGNATTGEIVSQLLLLLKRLTEDLGLAMNFTSPIVPWTVSICRILQSRAYLKLPASYHRSHFLRGAARVQWNIKMKRAEGEMLEKPVCLFTNNIFFSLKLRFLTLERRRGLGEGGKHTTYSTWDCGSTWPVCPFQFLLTSLGWVRQQPPSPTPLPWGSLLPKSKE